MPEYKQLTEDPPFLFADQNHTIHVFNSQTADEDGPQAIWYRKWTLAGGWSDLNDILVADNSEIELLDMVVDARSVVHLVMRIGVNIYYASAPLAAAGRAPAWSAPVLIGEQALPPFSATIASDAQGNTLYILYSGATNGKGVYSATSADSGATWSEPEEIFLTSGIDHVPAGLDSFLGSDQRLHVVWNVFDSRGIGVAGYYANLDSATGAWRVPMELDEGGILLGIKFATVFEYHDELLLTYYNGRTNQNYWRGSTDGAATWSAPALISPQHVGTNGPVSLVVDSSDTLHLLFGQRIDDNNHGMWHSVWTGAGWSEPTPVVRGPQVRDKIGGNGFDPRSARAVIVNGNLLFVAWATDGAAGTNGAWYAYTTLAAPELPAVALPVAAPATQPSLASPPPLPSLPPVATLAPPAQPKPVLPPTPSARTASPALPLIVGLAPAALLVSTAFLYHRLKQRGHVSH